MSNEIQQLHRNAYKSYGVILGDGFILFTKTWLKIIVPMALFAIISIIVKDLIMADINWYQIQLANQVSVILNIDPASMTNADLQILIQYLALIIGMLVLESIIGAFFTVLAMCLVSSYLLKKLQGLEVNFFQELKSSFNSRLFIVLVILGIVVPLGLFLLIPAIILFKLYIFSIFTYSDKSIEKPLKEARIMAKKTFWKTIGIFLISFGIPFMINFFIFHPILDSVLPFSVSWYDPVTRNYLMIILSDILYSLINILLTPLFICLLASFYNSLKARKAVAYSYQTEPVQTRYRTPVDVPLKLPQNQTIQTHKFETGMYCPYCGFFMEKRLEKCPHCNESLNFEF